MLENLIRLVVAAGVCYNSYRQYQLEQHVLMHVEIQNKMIQDERQAFLMLKEEYMSNLGQYIEIVKRAPDIARLEHVKENLAQAEQEAAALRAELYQLQNQYIQVAQNIPALAEAQFYKDQYPSLMQKNVQLQGQVIELMDHIQNSTGVSIEDEEEEDISSTKEEKSA